MKLKVFVPSVIVLLMVAAHFYNRKLASILSYNSALQLRHQKVIKRIPDNPSFAGEPVHFKNPEAYLKFYKELQVNTVKNSSTRLLLKNAGLWLPGIEKILVQYKIPKDFQYLAVAESNLNTNALSHKGAAGFWQFTESTATAYGLEVNEEVDERFHFEKSTRAACVYIRTAYRQFGSWTSAAASYNRGIGGLQRAFQNQSVNSYYDLELNRETSKYIFKIIAVRDIITHPQKYAMRHARFRLPKTAEVGIDTTVSDLSVLAQKLEIEYDILKAYNPWLLQNTLTIKIPGKKYILTIPKLPKRAPAIADTNRTKALKAYTVHPGSLPPSITI